MAGASYLSWPFFEPRHGEWRARVDEWARREIGRLIDRNDVDQTCRKLVRALGDAGLLRAVAPAEYGGMFETYDVRFLCLARETLAYHDGLADFAFAMQGLGAAPIALFGDARQKAVYLPPVATGQRIAAFALSEPDAGSDAAALSATAHADGAEHIRLEGEKTWISNGGIADHYIVFARAAGSQGAKGVSAYIVDADAR